MEKHLYDSFARWYRGGTIWFYSDPHFGDPEMEHIRKDYISDAEQVKRINSKVGRNDTLVILGDVGDVEWVRKLHGYKVLIMGNHDSGASNYKRVATVNGPFVYNTFHSAPYTDVWKKHFEEHPEYKKMFNIEDNHLFDEVYEGALMISPKIILSHEPIPNLPEWLFNIHGHDHSNWFTGSRHLNLCAEHINYTPVSIASIVKDGLLKDIVDIHRITIDNAIARKEKHNG